ncbi:phage tail tape measure protein [Campylobacter blaseri]|uniref:Phage tail tape measure protein n=1 Tax=Campylobacter blaseri TaxID=2042961 RepID=A0A2P8R0R2_9BACT|nr:phage tail tape measure protein [Campylobacter blaseri]PSM52084.1 phage tail tape measure protein [Campylobacter blaseri]PSM53869.1 phage tail tape measure protein [Campylobacter blaseri]QKF85575.1 phage tail tape measure protein [Campylobacter blaseri]
MQETAVGISIGIALKGLSGISTCTKAFGKLNSSIKKAGASVSHLKKDLSKMRLNIKTINKLDDEMKEFKSKMLEKIALIGSIALPVKIAIDYEASFADVKKYVDFANKEEETMVNSALKKISKNYGVSFADIADIAVSGGRLNLAAKDIEEYTTLTSKAAVAFEMSGKEAGDALSLLTNNLKMNLKELAIYADKINYLDNKMAMVNAKDLFNIIGRTAGSSKILGISEDKLASIASGFLSLGKAPEVASTAINSLLNRLANIDGQDNKFHKAVENMGLDANYLKIALGKDANKGLDRKESKTMSASEILELITTIICLITAIIQAKGKG